MIYQDTKLQRDRSPSELSAVITIDGPACFNSLDAQVDATKKPMAPPQRQEQTNQMSNVSDSTITLAQPKRNPNVAGTHLQKEHERYRPTANEPRRPSYASIAAQGMLNAIASQGSLKSQKSIETHHASDDGVTAEDTNVFSPRSARTNSTIGTAISTQDANLRGSNKQSPRFAQPTLSYSRRCSPPKRDGSPEKTSKRKGLPEEWLAGDTSSSTIVKQSGSSTRLSLGEASGAPKKPAVTSSHTSTSETSSRAAEKRSGTLRHTSTDDVTGSTAEQSAKSLAGTAKGEKGDRLSRLPMMKKSYLSPTKAAVQRAVETLGHDNTKQSSPRALAKLNTAASSKQDMCSPDSGLSSALSSLSSPGVNIIVDMPGQAAAAGFARVANVTSKRRESNELILQPIRAKLDRIGILKETAQQSGAGTGPSTAAYAYSQQDASTSPIKKAVPPHVRAVMRGPSSLRATALVFKPQASQIQPPSTPEQQSIELTNDYVMRFFSDDEWTALSPATRRAIYTKREEITGRPGRTKQEPWRSDLTARLAPSSTPSPEVFGISPRPARPSWSVTTPSKGASFGWAGGDGREIKFTGWGPDAEREQAMRMETEMEVPLAPRSQRQWAQLAYSREPCTTFDFIGAMEQMPMPMPYEPNVAGFCGRCVEVGGY